MAPAVSAVAVNVARYAVTPGGQRRGATPGKVRLRECTQEFGWSERTTYISKEASPLVPDTITLPLAGSRACYGTQTRARRYVPEHCDTSPDAYPLTRARERRFARRSDFFP